MAFFDVLFLFSGRIPGQGSKTLVVYSILAVLLAGCFLACFNAKWSSSTHILQHFSRAAEPSKEQRDCCQLLRPFFVLLFSPFLVVFSSIFGLGPVLLIDIAPLFGCTPLVFDLAQPAVCHVE